MLRPKPKNSGGFWIPTGQFTDAIVSEKKLTRFASSIFWDGGWSINPEAPHFIEYFEKFICSTTVSPYTVTKSGLRPFNLFETIASTSTRSWM